MSRVAIVLDLATGATTALPVRPEFIDPTVKGRVPCRPFGITWNNDELFIANNRQLLAFDKRLRYRRTLTTPLQINTHQLAYHEGWIWAVSPWTNSLIGVSELAEQPPREFNLLTSNCSSYGNRDACEEDDIHHFSSILWTSTGLYVGAHAFGNESFISHYDNNMNLLDIRCNVGYALHGLALCDSELFWISTNTAEVRSSRGSTWPLSNHGYARGFAVTSEYFIVALSEFLSRSKRYGGDSWIYLIERDGGAVIQDFHLHDTGSINDLRILDSYDYAHCVPPFWNKAEEQAAAADPPTRFAHVAPEAAGPDRENRRDRGTGNAIRPEASRSGAPDDTRP